MKIKSTPLLPDLILLMLSLFQFNIASAGDILNNVFVERPVKPEPQVFHVSIQIPASMEGKSFRISYDDGLNNIPVTDTFINHRLNLSGKFYSIAAVLKITHFGSDSIAHYDSYFIGTKPAKIIFSNSETMQVDGNFKCDTLLNAIEIYQSKVKKQRDAFIKNELDEMIGFCNKHGDSLYINDSLRMLFNKKINAINSKNIDFIKNNGAKYFSFWLFRTQILHNAYVNENATVLDFKNLLKLYNSAFPSTFKSTPEGKKMRELLTGRINTRINYPAPNFEMKDINGNVTKLSDFKGKYILIDFWATWCAPCMKEIPFIKKIRDDYPADQLAIISLSADTDFKKFGEVIKEKEMNWIHVYGEKGVPMKFGVTEYPTLFLIDSNGVIIFDSKGTDKDELITLLKKM